MASVRAEIAAAQAHVKAQEAEAAARLHVDNRTADEKLADSLGVDRKALPKLLETFAAFDKDGDGTIDVDELGTVLAALGRQTSEAKVREMIDTFNKGAADNSSILFPVFLDIVASGVIDLAALLAKDDSDVNPDGSMEHSMAHKTLQPKEIMKVRQAVERDNVKALEAVMDEYGFDINCTLNFLAKMKQGRHENSVCLGLDNNPRSGRLGSGPYTVLHYAKSKRSRKILAKYWEDSAFMLCINGELPTHSFRPTQLRLKAHATTADSIFLFELRKARLRMKTEGIENLSQQERDLLRDDIRAAEAEAKAQAAAEAEAARKREEQQSAARQRVEEATRKAEEARAAAAEVARLKAEQEAREEAEALAYFERQQRVCPVDDLRVVPNMWQPADTSPRTLAPLTADQQALVQRHRDGDTPAVVAEDPTTKRLFLIEDVPGEDGRPRGVAREVIPFEEVGMYELLLKIDATDGAAGALVPGSNSSSNVNDSGGGGGGGGGGSGGGGDASEGGGMMLAVSETQLDEIRGFLRGPDVDLGGRPGPISDDFVYKRDGAMFFRADVVAAEQMLEAEPEDPDWMVVPAAAGVALRKPSVQRGPTAVERKQKEAQEEADRAAREKAAADKAAADKAAADKAAADKAAADQAAADKAAADKAAADKAAADKAAADKAAAAQATADQAAAAEQARLDQQAADEAAADEAAVAAAVAAATEAERQANAEAEQWAAAEREEAAAAEAKQEAVAKAAARREVVSNTAATRMQHMFRERRKQQVLQEAQFEDGMVHGVDPEVAQIAEDVADSIVEAQSRASWAWYNGHVRKVHITRGDDWATQPLGVQAEMPEQLDLTYHGFEMRLSDPFLLLTAVNEDSYLRDFGLEAGDGVLTVDGCNFDTIGEFAALTKRGKDMVWEVMHVPKAPVTPAFRRRVNNAIIMRIGHEVKVRNYMAAAHEDDLDPPEREVPELFQDKRRSLDCLLAFVDLQGAAEEAAREAREQAGGGDAGDNAGGDGGAGGQGQLAQEPAPILCAVARAFELAGPEEVYSGYTNEEDDDFDQEDPHHAALETKLTAWRARRTANGRGQLRPGPQFMAQYAEFAARFPKGYGRRV